MNLEEKIKKLSEYIDQSDNIVFFGGAGVSTESGIPDFRSADGLYENKKEQKYDVPPEIMLSHTYFFEHTENFYDFYKSKMLYLDAKPNAAHKTLAKLEEKGKLKTIVTQNIDNLHQLAGSKNVIELHGGVNRNFCIKCNKKFDVSYIAESPGVPYCVNCGGIVKPDVVLYEEQLNQESVNSAIEYIINADMLIVGGTSLAVYPAAHYVNYFFYDGKNSKDSKDNKNNKRGKNKKSVIINKTRTAYDNMFDISIHEDGIGNILGKINL